MSSDIIQILQKLFAALICGAIGARIAGAGRSGCLAFLVIGLAGSFVGAYLAEVFHFPETISFSIWFLDIFLDKSTTSFIWHIVGAAALVAALNFIGLRKGSK